MRGDYRELPKKMKNPAASNSCLRDQRGFSMLAIAIFAVAVCSAILISCQAMNRSSETNRMRSMLASHEVTSRTDIDPLAAWLLAHEGVTGSCVVSGSIAPNGTATISSTSTTCTNLPIASDFNLPGNGRTLNFVGYTVTTTSGQVVRGFHLTQSQVQGDGPAGEDPTTCFPGSTLVLVSRTGGVNTYRRIDSFHPGDFVLSLSDVSPYLGRLAQHRGNDTHQRRSFSQLVASAAPVEVVGLYIHDPATENALRLKLNNGELVTTPSHPFFAVGRGWIHAGQLRLGDRLTTLDGDKTYIRAINEESPPAIMYNLHLAEDHTYLVLPEGSNSPVLVHNATTQKHGTTGF